MTIRILLAFIIVIFSSNTIATNTRVIDFEKIIENNSSLSSLYKKINKDQESHKDKFKNEEINLQSELKRIEKLNLILEPAELDKEIDNYNNKLNNFNAEIEKFNLHYELQINNLKNEIINITLEILKKYSEDNQIDLVLDSKNYVLSSNSINITDIIESQVNKKKIEISFEQY